MYPNETPLHYYQRKAWNYYYESAQDEPKDGRDEDDCKLIYDALMDFAAFLSYEIPDLDVRVPDADMIQKYISGRPRLSLRWFSFACDSIAGYIYYCWQQKEKRYDITNKNDGISVTLPQIAV